jgi:hypothetical protein
MLGSTWNATHASLLANGFADEFVTREDAAQQVCLFVCLCVCVSMCV